MGAVVRRALALVALVALVAVVILVACSKPSTEPTASSVASKAPKEYAAPSADRVGTLAPNTGVPVGSKAPDVHARDLDGNVVALSATWAKGSVLLVFYRGGWCPYCNYEIHALAANMAEYEKRGVTPVAISVDRPDIEAKTKATYRIPFPVLSDTDASVIEAFHVAKKVDAAERELMKSHGVDLDVQSGGAHHEIAIPALFLIDREGIVKWAHSDADYKTRPSTAQILAAIDALRAP